MNRNVLWLVLAVTQLAAQAPYDMVLKGGHVIDPKNGVDSVLDVAIRDGKIAAVAPAIPASSAARTVDVGGLYVTPGLIDIHVHVYAGTGVPHVYYGDNSVYPDDHSFKACTTTMVDAGSSGANNFEDFKQRIIDRSKTRVLAFLNIAGRGMDSGPIEQDLGGMDASLAAAAVKRYPDHLVGIKSAHYEGPEWTPGRSRRRGRPARQCARDGRFRDLPAGAAALGTGTEASPARRYLHAHVSFTRAHVRRGGQGQAVSVRGPETRRYLRCRAWRWQLRFPLCGTGHAAGLLPEQHFDGSAHRQHERRHERHGERHVEVPESEHDLERRGSGFHLEPGARNPEGTTRTIGHRRARRHRGPAPRERQVRIHGRRGESNARRPNGSAAR